MTKLQSMRKSRNMTQLELSDRTGISIRTIQSYESGGRSFDGARLEVLLKCAIALGCRLEDLIDSEECVRLLRTYGNSREIWRD